MKNENLLFKAKEQLMKERKKQGNRRRKTEERK